MLHNDRPQATNEGQSSSFNPVQISQNIFTGVSYASNGEKIYLTMELITAENSAGWTRYLECVSFLTGSSRSMMSAMPHFIIQNKSGDDVYYSFDYGNKDKNDIHKSLGFEEHEFYEFIQMLGKNGFYRGSKKNQVLGRIAGGASALDTRPDPFHFIVYATKSPNFNINDINQTTDNKFIINIKDFIACYSKIIMVVGSNLSCDKVVENRGIFRDPYNTVENTYPGIAMILVGFTAAVIAKFFPDKEYFAVRPMEKMKDIIELSFENEDFVTNHSGIQLPATIDFNMDPRLIIKIPALVKLFHETTGINFAKRKPSFFSISPTNSKPEDSNIEQSTASNAYQSSIPHL